MIEYLCSKHTSALWMIYNGIPIGLKFKYSIDEPFIEITNITSANKNIPPNIYMSWFEKKMTDDVGNTNIVVYDSKKHIMPSNWDFFD